MNNRAMRTVIENARKLSRLKAGHTLTVKDGNHIRESATGSQVIFCPNCQAPVVNSGKGRLGHAQRKPECAEAMGI